MMSGWAIVAIIAIIAWVVVRYNEARHGITYDEHGNETRHVAGPDPDTQAELTELRERVKVLERIATEDTEARRLSSQIDRLRED